MPHSNRQKIRLPSWNLLFLAAILSGGGFFCFITYQQQLLLQLDYQLLDPAEVNSRLNIFASILMLSGIGILTCFAVLQRKLSNGNMTVIKRLTTLMERTNADTQPPEFQVAETGKPEARNLALSYNALMNRLADNLRRSRQFAADVTHELRTPLTILRGETELALRSDRDQEQLRQVLESNLEEISRMSYLIEDLLLLSKSDLGEIPLKMDVLNVTELISELHHQAQLLAENKNIKVNFHSHQQPAFLHADSLRLRQVFLNILTNAFKYTPDNGTVTITLKCKDDKVEIAISDNGIGIDSTHLEKIFERFYRVDKTRNRNDGGSGLGLAITKWIVDAHGGSVQVSSVPSQGSTFTVLLPLAQQIQKPE